ncbi:MAG: dTDP-4-dehydrorhamnose reductase [Acidobacteriota bacterium]
MKIMITGAGGMLGQRLVEEFSARHSVQALSHRQLDITSMRRVRERVFDSGPDWILHAAAFTRVDEAETQFEKAYRVNAVGTRNLASAAFANHCALLYYSTDYVFDGKSGRPYREWDPPSPVNAYGASKLAGEVYVCSLCPAHLIIRTSWLFGPGGVNFVNKVVERCRSGAELRMVDDQRGSPTYTLDLARISRLLVEGNKRGTYHVTNSGHCSWYELARKIVELKALATAVTPVPASEYPVAAKRPAYSVLENCLLTLEKVPPLRSWQDAIAEYLGGPG